MNAITPVVPDHADPKYKVLGYKVDTTRGTTDDFVSRQWFKRPDDERFLSLTELLAACQARKDDSEERVSDAAAIEVRADHDNGLLLSSDALGGDNVAMTCLGFGRVCQLAEVPANYLSELPSDLVAPHLRHGLSRSGKSFKSLMQVNRHDRRMLRALTSDRYGRIWDADVIAEVMKWAGDGVGQTRWKVPGQIDWSTHIYNPNTEITRQSTTLYAGERDCFIFLVDDRNPIQIGTLPDGSPDLVFRGVAVWNSEVGERTIGFKTIVYRGSCQNRMCWGVEQSYTYSMRHTSGAPLRFLTEMLPMIEGFVNSSALSVAQPIAAARAAIVATSDDEAANFLRRAGVAKTEIPLLMQTSMDEEDRPIRSMWDAVQAMTARARLVANADARFDLERGAERLLTSVVSI